MWHHVIPQVAHRVLTGSGLLTFLKGCLAGSTFIMYHTVLWNLRSDTSCNKQILTLSWKAINIFIAKQYPRRYAKSYVIFSALLGIYATWRWKRDGKHSSVISTTLWGLDLELLQWYNWRYRVVTSLIAQLRPSDWLLAPGRKNSNCCGASNWKMELA